MQVDPRSSDLCCSRTTSIRTSPRMYTYVVVPVSAGSEGVRGLISCPGLRLAGERSCPVKLGFLAGALRPPFSDLVTGVWPGRLQICLLWSLLSREELVQPC